MKSILNKWISLTLFSLSLTSCGLRWHQSPQIVAGGINSNSSEEYPTISGDGRWLAFASDRKGHRDIYLYDFQGRSLVSLPGLNRRNSSQDQPSISADGRYIVFVSNERGRTDIVVYDRQSRSRRLISADIRGSVRQPTISGDGQKIAFQTNQTGQWKIAIADNQLARGQ